MSHFPLRSARAHVHTPSLYIRNGLTDRAQICCVVESLFVTRFSHVMGHISHCGLHAPRTCTPHIYTYIRNGLADCAQICCVFVTQSAVTQSVCAEGGLRGGRFARLAGWRFAWLVVCAVGGLHGCRFARLAVCAIGGLRG